MRKVAETRVFVNYIISNTDQKVFEQILKQAQKFELPAKHNYATEVSYTFQRKFNIKMAMETIDFEIFPTNGKIFIRSKSHADFDRIITNPRHIFLLRMCGVKI